jgi:hypothetical protein
MSKIALTPSASGTGVFTISSPATNTNRTLTLPDEAGTVDLLQRAGNVLQVVSVQYNSQSGTSSGTYVDSGLQASITPTSSASRILALVTLGGFELNAAALAAYFNLTRDATQIFQPNAYVGYPNGVLRTVPAPSFTFLDTPATTSSTTYKVRFFAASALGVLTINVNGSQSSITLMEIAA